MNRLMMIRGVAAIVFCIAFGTSMTAVAQETELLGTLEGKLKWLEYRLTMERWDRAVGGSADSLGFFEELFGYTLADAAIRPMIQKIESGTYDEEARRKARIIEDLSMRYVVDGHQPVSGLLDSLRTMTGTQTGYLFEGEDYAKTELEAVVAADPDRSRREQAWRLLRSGQDLADPMARLFRLRNQQARREGFNSFFSMIMSSRAYSLDEYRSLLQRVDSGTREAYQSLLTRLKTRLRVDVVEPWDLEYAYRDVLAGIDIRLISDTIVPLAKATFDSIGVDADELPIYYAFRDTTLAPVEFDYYPVRPPHDLRIAGSITGGHSNLKMLLASLGQAMYGCHIHQEQALFSRPLQGAFGQSIGAFFRMIADDPRWLSEFAALPEQVTADFVSARRDLALIELRFLLLWQYFEMEAYGDGSRDLNKLFWELYEKHLLMPRHEEIAPWAAETDFALWPGRHRDRLVGRLIAAQTWNYIERVNGSVIDNRDTRSFLIQNYFRFGRLYAWPELVKRGTGEALNPAYYIAYLGL
ncbi:MAG: M3 family metallopeptidase [candidate division Zixibacteria bacterium]|jgi:peptidyl-dipeptidase A|nr:M3 family metallopeptidase [candidate division Zixibacteria bacterium]